METIKSCHHCGEDKQDMYPSCFWYPGKILCGECSDQEQDEYSEEQEYEDEDFTEELRISHLYSWC